MLINKIIVPNLATKEDLAQPLIRLSPPRPKYAFSLRRTEGVCDLFMGGSIAK